MPTGRDPNRRRTRRRRGGIVAVALAALLVIAGVAAYGLPDGGRGSVATDDGAAFASAQLSAMRGTIARLQARLDAQDLRIKVLESQSAYKTLDGAILPAVPDPLAPPPLSRGASDPDP